MKKAVSGLVSVSLLVFTMGYVPAPALAAVTGTFTAVTTVANVSATNDQLAVATTTVGNVTTGSDLTQDAIMAVTIPNVVGAASTAIFEGITVTANAPGLAGDNISVEIHQVDVDLGACPNDATVGVERSGNVINVYVQHNTNPAANCAASPVDVYQSTVAEALNIATTASLQGDLVTATTTGDVNTLITASGGSPVTKVGTVAQTYLAGGIDGVAQQDTITISSVVEEGDIFTAHLPGADASYVAQLGDDVDIVAAGLNTAIQTSLGYVGFTSGVLANVITLTASIPGVPFSVTSDATNRSAVAQQSTITLSGTVEEGDTYTTHIPSDDVSYIVQAGDTTTDDIALGLNTAIQASAGYIDFTSNVVGNVVTLTATTPGTGFTLTTDATNRTAIAQETTFTPTSVITGETFRSNINGSYYNYLAQSGDGVAQVTGGIVSSMDGAAGISCSEDSTKVTCTADVAGVPFAYSATVVDETAPVITLNGTASTTVQYLDAFVDAGATTDDGSSVVVGGDTVDNSVLGDYTITYDSTDSNGNNAIQKTRVVHIVPAPSFTSVSCPASVTYNSVAQTPCTASVTGIGGLSDSLTVNYTSNTNVGTASADASFAGDTTHAASSDLKNFTIDPKSLTASASASDKVYDGTLLATASVSLTGIVGGDDVSASGSASFADKHVGINKVVTVSSITLSGTAVGNYTLNNSSAVDTADITPASLTVTAVANTKVYDGDMSASGTIVNVTGLQFGDSANFIEAYDNKNVGTGKTLTPDYAFPGGLIDGNSGNNYTVSLVSQNVGDITPASVIVSATGHNKVYDAMVDAAVDLNVSGVIGLDVVDATGTVAFADANVGVGKNVHVSGIVLGSTDAGNYTANVIADTTADITLRPITVATDSFTKEYLAVDPSFTYLVTSGNLVGTDAFSGAITRDVGEDLGVFNITQGTFTAGANYNLVFNNGTLTVVDTTAPVVSLNGGGSVTAWTNNGYVEQGATVTDNHDIGLTAVITGSVDDQTPGTYVLTYTATDGSGNTASTTRTVGILQSGGGGGGSSSGGGQVLGEQVSYDAQVAAQIAALKTQIAALIQQLLELLKQQLAATLLGGSY